MDTRLNDTLNSPPEPQGNTVEQDTSALLDDVLQPIRERGTRAWKPARFDRATILAGNVEAYEAFLERYDTDLADAFAKLREELDAARERYNELGFDGDFTAYQEECRTLVDAYFAQIDTNEMNERLRVEDYSDLGADPTVIQQHVAISLVPDAPVGYYEIEIPKPEGISQQRLNAMVAFINHALTAHWIEKKKAASETPDSDERPPSLLVDYTNCEYDENSMPVNPPLKLRSQRTLKAEELAGIEAVVSKEFEEFREGWRYQQKGKQPPFAYKEVTHDPSRMESRIGYNAPAMSWKMDVLYNIENDLRERDILPSNARPADDEDDDHIPQQKSCVGRRSSTRNKSFYTVTGEREIVSMLKDQFGVQQIQLGGREGRAQ